MAIFFNGHHFPTYSNQLQFNNALRQIPGASFIKHVCTDVSTLKSMPTFIYIKTVFDVKKKRKLVLYINDIN